jgi:hypothetical protein
MNKHPVPSQLCDEQANIRLERFKHTVEIKRASKPQVVSVKMVETAQPGALPVAADSN